MRIVSGTYKGRRFSPPKNFKARPTTDYAKENLFNILNNEVYFDQIEVLDLFAGTGSISFEFASRGCEHIDTVELNQAHVNFIHKVKNELNINAIRVIRGDAFKYIEKTYKKYDVIFADPPYEMKNIETIPESVFNNKILNPGGWLIFEHSGRITLPNNHNLKETRKYGSVNFSIYREDRV